MAKGSSISWTTVDSAASDELANRGELADQETMSTSTWALEILPGAAGRLCFADVGILGAGSEEERSVERHRRQEWRRNEAWGLLQVYAFQGLEAGDVRGVQNEVEATGM